MIARRLFLKMMGLAPFAALAGKAVEAQAEERPIEPYAPTGERVWVVVRPVV